MKPAALITGSTRGIGLGIARQLLTDGFNVALNGRGAIPGDLVDQLGQDGEVTYIQGDVSIGADRDRMLNEFLTTFGRIDVLVNNAGITSPGRKDISEVSETDLDTVLDVNLKGPFFLTQAVALHMILQNDSQAETRGRIINISSVSSVVVSPNRAEYCISKAGVSMMSQLWAVRLAPERIDVYEIRPGIIRTDMTKPVADKYDRLIEEGLVPENRWGSPQDVAQVVSTLAQGMVPYSTGQVFTVDGGLTIPRL